MPATAMARVISKEAVLLLLGGRWPKASEFSFDALDEFRILTPGFLQGFHADEPVGPAIMYSAEVVPEDRPLGVFLETKDLLILTVRGVEIRLWTVEQMKEMVAKAPSKLNPEFKIEKGRCGIVLDYPKGDEDEGRRTWESHSIGGEHLWKHPEDKGLEILVFNRSDHTEILCAFHAVRNSIQRSLRYLIGMDR